MTSPSDEGEAPVRIAALYRFAHVADPAGLRARLETVAAAGGVRGTLLVAAEGVNGTVAGPPEGVAALEAALRAEPGFDVLEIKYATAEAMPFHRLKVRVKSEIVTLGVEGVDAARDAGTYVEPDDWNALIADPDVLLIDTRNDYEGEIGAFEGAVQPNTRTFRDFPDWFRAEGRAMVEGAKGPRRVAMYCTGGIRCEKATAFLKAEGVDEVFHLKGGILNYLETVPEPESLWRGECFVFDERVAVGHGLADGSHELCRACRMPVSSEQKISPLYVEGVACPRCAADQTEAMRAARAERHRQVTLAAGRGEAHIGTDAAVRQDAAREARRLEREKRAREAEAEAGAGVASSSKSA
jgi:UPF0176 protein